MTVIADRDRLTVRDVLARELVGDVELLLFVGGRASQFDADGAPAGLTSDETRELLEQLVSLSPRLYLTVHDVRVDPATATGYNVDAVPTVIIRKRASEAGQPAGASNVRFVGLPGGYEFSTLVADIVDVSQGQTSLSAQTVEAVRALDTPVHIQVFVTPSCPYCPRAARIAHQLAMTTPLVLAEVIEANEFQALSERYAVQSVPKTVIHDRIQFVGPLPEGKVLAAVQEAVRQEAVRQEAVRQEAVRQARV
jgi:glutaredoxin-like protein